MRVFPLVGVKAVLPRPDGSVYAVAGGQLWRLPPGGENFQTQIRLRGNVTCPKTATYMDWVEVGGVPVVGVRAVGTAKNPWWRGYDPGNLFVLPIGSDRYTHQLGGDFQLLAGRRLCPGEPGSELVDYFTDGRNALVAVRVKADRTRYDVDDAATLHELNQVDLYAVDLAAGDTGGPFPCFEPPLHTLASTDQSFAVPTTPGLVTGVMPVAFDYFSTGDEIEQLKLWRPNEDCVPLTVPGETARVFDVHSYDFKKVAVCLYREPAERARSRRTVLGVGDKAYAFDGNRGPFGARFSPDGLTLWYWTRNVLVAFDVD